MSLRGIIGGRKVFEYSTLAAMMGVVWVVPQGIELESSPWNYYRSGGFWLYVTGCFSFVLWGFEAGKKAQRVRISRNPTRVMSAYKLNRLLYAAAGLTALGWFATLRMGGIDTSGMGAGWTGIATMWYLLATANSFGLCLAALIFARNRSPIALTIAIIAAVPLFGAAFGAARREQLFDFMILTGGVWYFVKGRYPPRTIVILGLFLGAVILNTVGDLRSQLQSGERSFVELLLAEDTYRNFDFFDLQQGEASEVRLAQYDYWYSNYTWRWELGSDHWNGLVHQYIPAFLVGRDFKESLKISTLSERLRRGEEEGAFSLGSTRTGFSDSYRAFGWFGMLLFFAIGYGFGFLYANAMTGGIVWQYFYFVLLAEGLKAITHSTSELLRALPFVLVLSLIFLSWARTNVVTYDRRLFPTVGGVERRSRRAQRTNILR